jgi:hypothetical protein
VSFESLVDVAWRFFDISVVTGEILGWLALIMGIIGFGTTKKHSDWSRRSRGLISGGSAALAGTLLMEEVYNFVKYLMLEKTGAVNHQAVLYPEPLLNSLSSNGFDVVTLAGVVAQFGAIFGMAGFAFGAGLWGITGSRSRWQTSSIRILYSSVVLMGISVSERALAAVTFVFSASL